LIYTIPELSWNLLGSSTATKVKGGSICCRCSPQYFL
jgi:hypothetical protein